MAKSKFQKKKEREREVKKKILDRRERKHAIEKEKAKFDAEEKSVRHKERPIRNEEFYAARDIRDREIRMQLEHNLKLLEGLQKEYEEELKKRADYVKQLKEAGASGDTLIESTDGEQTKYPADLVREDGTLVSPEELLDKANLTEQAASRLNDIYEKWRIKGRAYEKK